MKTLLLLGGRSRRFWPLSEKPLFPVCGKTLLEHQIGRLREAGCGDIVLVGGAHNLDLVQASFPEIPTVEQEDLERGMQGALLSALPQCGNEAVMIVSSNDVIETSAYVDLKKKAEHPDADGGLLAQHVSRYFPGGYIQTEGEKVVSIIEKPGEGNEPSDLINIVAHVHNDASILLGALKKVKSKRDDGYEIALDALFKKYTYHAVPYKGAWQAVKYPWHILPLLELFLQDIKEQQIDPSADIHPTAVIEGPVVIEKEARVMAHAVVQGPCYIGPGAVVANNALARQSSIGEKCVVGFASEVKGSVLASHVWTHMTYIGDSVIGNNVSFGGGSTTGNFRLDEAEIVSEVKGEMVATGLQKFGTAIGDDCRFGSHTTLNPGIKIGEGTFVTSAVLITEDIPDKSFVTIKAGEMHVRENKSGIPTADDRKKYIPRNKD